MQLDDLVARPFPALEQAIIMPMAGATAGKEIATDDSPWATRAMKTYTPSTASSNRSKHNFCWEMEGASSTGTDGTRQDSDSLSDSDVGCTRDLPSIDEQLPMLPLGSCEDDEGASDPGFRTPDPFDSMPYVRVPPAFSEAEIAEALARNVLKAKRMQEEKEREDAATAGAMPSSGAQSWPEAIAVPVPMPMPFGFPMPLPPCVQQVPRMPVPLSLPALPKSLVVPPGYKLVRIPGLAVAGGAAAPAQAGRLGARPSISDATENGRKIFVGGLSPATTEISLVKYFSDYGVVEDATVVREANKSRGFGFVQFRDGIPPEVLEKKHIIDQRRCGVTVAVPRGPER
jgi:hypothetical protein